MNEPRVAWPWLFLSPSFFCSALCEASVCALDAARRQEFVFFVPQYITVYLYGAMRDCMYAELCLICEANILRDTKLRFGPIRARPMRAQGAHEGPAQKVPAQKGQGGP